MTTLDDLARVERDLRESFPPTEQMAGYGRRAIYGWADTIAAYIAAQSVRDATSRERDVAAVKLPPPCNRWGSGYDDGWNDCIDAVERLNTPQNPKAEGFKEPTP